MINEDKSIKYVNKSFGDFKASLQEFAKTYFPNTYNDFSDASPGSMFIEMASYVGDVSSFYIDSQIQENFLNLAKEKESLYNLAYSFGYRPKSSYASTTNVDIYQLIPSVGGSPNLSYSLLIPANTTVTSNTDFSKFITIEDVDFSHTSSAEITYYNTDYFLMKKSVPVISAEIKTYTASISTPTKFNSFTINDSNILQILEVKGDDGDKFYEVPYLAQNVIFSGSLNPSSGSDGINYLMNLQQVPKRFVTRIKNSGSIELQFGAGVADINNSDTVILPTPNNINLGLISSIADTAGNYNKASIFYTKSYGVAPSTNLNIKYLVGGGIEANIPANSLTALDTTLSSGWFKYSPSDAGIKTLIISNLLINNPSPATGGRGGDTVEEIRLNTLNAYTAQNRAVTKEDYIIRTLSLPSQYGNIAKAYITQEIFNSTGNLLNSNPLSLDLYVLGYNSTKKLINANTTLKNNLKTYLNQYRMITDAINIKNAFYINIGVDFEINADPSYNNKELLSNCISQIKDYFNIDSWQINQPVVISEINALLLKVPGVRSIHKIEITNKQGGDYSPYGYDIISSTRNNIVYPSIDPSIFEIRFPDNDINGRVITY
jgi:hypothetical protein